MNRKIMLLALIMPWVLFAQINWTKHIIDGNFDGADKVFAIDIDGDEDIDVLGTAWHDDEIAWWENDDDDTTWIKHIIDGDFDGALNIFAIDMDGDEDIDVLGTALYDYLTWWEHDNDTWIKHPIVGTDSSGGSVHPVDMDGDSDIDIVNSKNKLYEHEITWWENDDDDTTWTKHTINPDFRAHEVYAIDLDNDGDNDVLGASVYANEIHWWENDNDDTTWTEHMLHGYLWGVCSVYPIDLDSDGDNDVLGASACVNRDDYLAWWENDNDDTTWTKHTIAAGDIGFQKLFAIDIDGDDDIDILSAETPFGVLDDDIVWWENVDDDTTWTKHIIAYFNSSSLYAADLDNDGDNDVLGSDWDAGDIVWWESDLDPFVLDVGTISIDVSSPLPEGTILSPQATVKNIGIDSETFDVTCEINPGGYSSTESVSDLAPGDSIQVIFSPDFTFATGDYTVKVYTQLIGDENPANDTLEKVIETYEPGIEEGNQETPTSFSFNLRNNPAKGKVVFNLALPEPASVSLQIYDVSGRQVYELVAQKSAGNYEIPWTLKITAGVYFYSFASPWKNETGKLVFVK
jgi:hypothetical protein